MALKNIEEALIERIQQSVAKELRRLRRAANRRANGHTSTDKVGAGCQSSVDRNHRRRV